jgi:chromosome segregation ATPase
MKRRPNLDLNLNEAESNLFPSIANVPLPHQIPPAPKLENLPARVLHTATVETLIDYSEDLASRLKVHLRRGGQLEQQIIDLENQITDSERMRAALQAQIEILREKDRSISEKNYAAETKAQRINDELNLARLEGGELSSRNKELQIQLLRAKSYKRRVQRWVAPGMLARQKTIQDLKIRILDYEAEVMRANANCTNLRDELQYLKTETDRRLTSGERDRARLVDQYEKRVKQMETENTQVRGDLVRANERLAVLDQTTTESARANNEKVFFERRAEEFEARLKSETSRLQGTLNDLAAECATLRASVEAVRAQRDTSDQARKEAEASRSKAEAQLLSLREIWQENSVRLQALEAQNEALEKLNGELSQRLSDARDTNRVRINDQALNNVGFVEDRGAREAKLKKLDLILSDLEMKAFGIHPSTEKSSSP